jgi:CRISPR-associated protein Csm3
MFAKIEITGMIKILTGMHIGGSSEFAAIGAVDSPVIRDVYTDQPMIPGSSVKGKMRYLLSRQYAKDNAFVKIKDDDGRIKRLFGYSNANKNGQEEQREAHASRLQIPDMFLSNGEELKLEGIPATEIKFENTIDRITAVANPRQIERISRGTEFGIHWIYNAEKKEEIEEDFRMIGEGIRLLKYDYLGGHGSRGYGKITFANLDVSCVIGDIDDEVLEKCRSAVTGA